MAVFLAARQFLRLTPSPLVSAPARGKDITSTGHVFPVRIPLFARLASSEGLDTQSSWLERLKGLWRGKKEETGTPAQPAVNKDDFTLERFADELKRAGQFGKMTKFGRGLPRGGEASALLSLQRQEDILRKLAIHDPSAQRLGAEHKKEVALQCGCTVRDVDDVLGKFEWAKEAKIRMDKLQEEGKPVPKSLEEIEKLMGGRWSASASVNLSKSGQPSRNSPCPCGSGKKFKRCCANR